MTRENDLDRLVEEITSKIFRQNGCRNCSGDAHGGARNCEQVSASERWTPETSDAVQAIIDAGATRISTQCRLSGDRTDLAGMIDHTLLKPNGTKESLVTLCKEAKKFGFCSVCVHPAYVSFCKKLLEGTSVKVCTVIGFPLGCNTPEVKAFEADVAQRDGATELDMVINVGALKSREYDYVEADIQAVVRTARPGTLVKVILETALLTDEEIVRACEICRDAGAHFVKTSTGFASGGATASDVALMRRVVGDGMGVKASGGVGDASRADLMVRSGADRIGASASIKIVEGGASSGGGY